MQIIGAVKNGQQGVVLRVKLVDANAVGGDYGKDALTYASTGLIIAAIADNEAVAKVYTSAGNTIEDITTLGTYQAPSSGCCRFKEVDAANMRGIYEIHLANARFAVSGAKQLLVTIPSDGVVWYDFNGIVLLTAVDPPVVGGGVVEG